MIPSNAASWICCEANGDVRHGGPIPRLIFPGSFNPLHRGHLELASFASRRFGEPVSFELSIANVDKADLELEEVRRRIEQFRGSHSVVISRAPKFREKAELFPSCTFVVGADTAMRIVQPRYYGGETEMNAALDFIRERGCRFFVGGRVGGDGRFLGLGEIEIPEPHLAMFEGLSESEFRVDLSSTELRR